MHTTTEWSREYFLAFALFYAAAADQYMHPDELDLIHQHVGNEAATNAQKTLESLNDQQRIDVLLSYRDLYFSTDRQKQEILDLMLEVLKSDHELDQAERAMFLMLKKLL